MTESSCRLEVVRCLTMLCYLGYYITGGVEYCWEDFNATCAEDEVIMMQTAFYGRMEQGRCLPQDQQLGCRDNIITYMDSRCSGRQSCVQPVPDKNLQILSSCPQMMSYLNATYSCIKVAYPKKSSPLHCSKESRTILYETAGYISSHVSLATLTGTTSCPWVISVPKGQKVNLTLVDFSVSEGMSGSEDVCAMYAKLRDGVRKTADITVCGGEVREKGIYLSDSHSVEIEINAALSHNTVHMPHFVIKYQAVGCPDLVAPPGGWLERHDHKMALGCNDTGEVRHLVCSDNSWVGEISNCSGAHLTSSNGAHGFVRKEVPFGLVLAIVIGVVLGIIIGSLLLGVVLYTQNRLKHRRGAGFTGNATDQEKRQILQSVAYPKKSSPLHCSKESRTILNETAGYISSHVSLATLTGTTSCPWVISVPKGQKVNLTLVDFSVSEGMSGSEDVCAMYAKLRDGVRKTADITVCGGEVREKGIYLSDSHSVEIEINAALSHNTLHTPHFVIKYQAVGCPDLVAPPGGWLERHDHKMALGCNDTGEVRHLVCSDNSWVGEISNCSGAHLTSANGAHGFVRKEVPFGLVLAIVIGVVLGIIIGSLLLGVVLYTQNRLKHRRGAGFTGNATDQEKRQILQSGNYGYAHVWELQQLRGSPGSPGAQDPQNPPTTQPTNICPREFGTHLGKPPGFPPAQISHKDHSYESPRFSAGHSHGHGHTHIIPRNTESSGTLIPKCHEFDVHIKTTVGGNTGVAPPRQQETNTEARYSE